LVQGRASIDGVSGNHCKQTVANMTATRKEVVEAENVNHPGRVKPVDAEMYQAMKRAFLEILPRTSPGLTLAQVRERIVAHIPEEVFPGGARAGWWAKTVQLDLEAKGTIARAKTKPLRLRRT
jgi:hypothetical protein